jgi:hypothetical protein
MESERPEGGEVCIPVKAYDLRPRSHSTPMSHADR